MHKIRKICIANRAEIAVRIADAAHAEGIKCLAVYADEDKDNAHIHAADEAVSLGGGSLTDTYLNRDKIIAVALDHACDALHPGYGFLSENADFAEACEKAGIIFIGPSPQVIRLMGDKLQAREFVNSSGAPVTPGLEGSAEILLKNADQLDYPVLIKAAAGGGGKGMQPAADREAFRAAMERCRREAKAYFGNDTVYVEKFLQQPRHIEVQILGDRHGNIVHVFERECSIQRRYQKIIEEAPAPGLSPEVRSAIHESALKIAKAAGYFSAGTVEFLLDNDGKHYFLEMNTRIQVEHPITERISGIDLVREQIRIAEGRELQFSQQDITCSGHAVECRIYAEDPADEFRPAPGQILYYREPAAGDLRIDSSVKGPVLVRSMFDPMISKLISQGRNRQEAIRKISVALDNYKIFGIATNISFLKHLVDSEDLKHIRYSTKYIEDNYHRLLMGMREAEMDSLTAPVMTAPLIMNEYGKYPYLDSVWREIGRWRASSVLNVSLNGKEYALRKIRRTKNEFTIAVNDHIESVKVLNTAGNHLELESQDQIVQLYFVEQADGRIYVSADAFVHVFIRKDVLGDKVWLSREDEETNNMIRAKTPGKIIKLSIEKGQQIAAGDEILVLEAMKMESSVRATHAARVSELKVAEGQQVEADELLLVLEGLKEENDEKDLLRAVISRS